MRLSHRLEALEAGQGDMSLSHLSDEELRERLEATMLEIEAHLERADSLTCDWRVILATPDPDGLQLLCKELQCTD